MNIQYKNILLLGDYPEESSKTSVSRRILNSLCAYFERTSIQEKGYGVTRVQIAKTIEEANTYLKREYIDVLITMDKIGDMPVGVGKIKRWREISPNTKTILLMRTETRGGKKVQALFDIKFYDACFFQGLSMGEINMLILHGRPAAMAEKYYGLQPMIGAGTIGEVQNGTPAETKEETQETIKSQKEPESSMQEQDSENSENEKVVAAQAARTSANEEPAGRKEHAGRNSDSPQNREKGKMNPKRKHLSFKEGKVISVLNENTVIIETMDSNGLQKGDIVAVPNLSGQEDFTGEPDKEKKVATIT